MHVLLQNMCRTFMSYHVLFELSYIVLSYYKQRWNAFMPIMTACMTKAKRVQLFRK